MFSKSLETALSAMSLLAERHGTSAAALTADQIARARRLNRPFVSKLLSALARDGLVSAKPGRSGGFQLGRPPEQIRLVDVATSIGHRARIACCPFDASFDEASNCARCPLHQALDEVRDVTERFLRDNTLAVFTQRPADCQGAGNDTLDSDGDSGGSSSADPREPQERRK